MMTTVMILANRGAAWGAMAIAGFVFLPFVMNLILGGDNQNRREQIPHDSIGTKLRMFRDARVIQCERQECQAWNPTRARFCRHCGTSLRRGTGRTA